MESIVQFLCTYIFWLFDNDLHLLIFQLIRWMSLGNQLSGVRLVDEGLRARFKAAYPDVEVQPASPPRASAMEVDSNAPQMRSPFVGSESKSTPTPFTEATAPVAPYVSEQKPMNPEVEMTG